MATQEEIEAQQRLLETHRRTLAIFLSQRAALGSAFVPPAVIHGIREARQNISRAKQILRAWGLQVADHPDDEDHMAADLAILSRGNQITQGINNSASDIKPSQLNREKFPNSGQEKDFADGFFRTLAKRYVLFGILIAAYIFFRFSFIWSTLLLATLLLGQVIVFLVSLASMLWNDRAFRRLIILQVPIIILGYYYSGQKFQTYMPETKTYAPITQTYVLIGSEIISLLISLYWDTWKGEFKLFVNAVSTYGMTEVIKGWLPKTQRGFEQQIIYTHRSSNVRGLRTQGSFVLKVEEMFVPLRITPANLQKNQSNIFSSKHVENSRSIWDYLRMFPENSRVALVVIGPPGSGKTTLLQHAALILAKHSVPYRTRASLPLFLFIRDIAEMIPEQPHDISLADPNIALGTLAEKHFTTKYPKLDIPSGWIARKLEKGRCLVLLDGLDEVAQNERRRVISKWIDDQILLYPRCSFIITARPKGYQSAQLQNRDAVLEIQPFTMANVSNFVHKWYLANEKLNNAGVMDEGVRQNAERDANDLLKRLNSLPRLSAMTVNPLLLTMITIVHNYRGALPGRRVELYAEICDVFLGHWRQAIGVHDPLTAVQKRVILQPLAAYMMESRIRDLTTREVRKIIDPHLHNVGIFEQEADRFLEDIQLSSGILLERELDQWSFAHHTFQEYLASCYWIESGVDQSWQNLISDTWWHETILLYAAQSNATSIIRTCLELNTASSLSLAAQCIEEARTIDNAVRNETITLLQEQMNSTDPQRRALGAEVRLVRRLAELYRIDDIRFIDLFYITCAEYQLFLDSAKAQGKHYTPREWLNETFTVGRGDAPVRGVSSDAAIAFCQWLSEHRGSEVFRLPTTEEVTDCSARDGERLAAWCQDNDGVELKGLSANDIREIIQFLQVREEGVPLPKDYDVTHYESYLGYTLDIENYIRDRTYDRATLRKLQPDHVKNVIIELLEDLNKFRVLALSDALGIRCDGNSAINKLPIIDQVINVIFDDNKRLIVELNMISEITRMFDVVSRGSSGSIGKDPITELLDLIASLIKSESIYNQRAGKILTHLIKYYISDNETLKKRLVCYYGMNISELIWIGYRKSFEPSRHKYDIKVGDIDFDDAILTDNLRIQNIYWAFRILVMQMEGEVGAWGGIRIVRESYRT